MTLDNNWLNRHEMMKRWKRTLLELGREVGFSVLPDLKYDVPKDHNAPVTSCLLDSGETVNLESALSHATVFIAFSDISISSTLILLCNKLKTLRGVSMPGIVEDMERTALSADYSKIRKKCKEVARLMKAANFAEVLFSTGDECRFDLRFRNPLIDDGYCGIEKLAFDYDQVINLPSGEVCQSPYEGEQSGTLSQTNGVIPMLWKNKIVTLEIEQNKIINVVGDPECAQYFIGESGRCNIAEFAIGVNDKAVIRGNILEDEKAGFHFAYGRSDHLGGVWDVTKFKNRDNACHIDVVYAKDSPICVKRAHFIDDNEKRTPIYKNGVLVI